MISWPAIPPSLSGSSPGASTVRKRWPARNFRVRDCSCAPGEWRHCTTSRREGRGTGGERYAPATFLSRRADSPGCQPAPAAERKGRMRQAGQTGRWSRAQRRPRPARTRDEAVRPDNRRQRSTGLSDADSFSRGITMKMPNLAPPGHQRKPGGTLASVPHWGHASGTDAVPSAARAQRRRRGADGPPARSRAGRPGDSRAGAHARRDDLLRDGRRRRVPVLVLHPGRGRQRRGVQRALATGPTSTSGGGASTPPSHRRTSPSASTR